MSNLIDRQAVVDILKRFKPEIIPYEKARSYVEETINTMYDRIEELPTVQPDLIEKYKPESLQQIQMTHILLECATA